MMLLCKWKGKNSQDQHPGLSPPHVEEAGQQATMASTVRGLVLFLLLAQNRFHEESV